MLRVSRDVPGGVAGFDEGPSGRLVLLMVDTLQADTVRAALRAAFADQQSPTERATFSDRLAGAELRRVAFSLAQLHDWLGYLTALVLPDAKREGVDLISTGLNPNRARITISVGNEAARAWVEGRLSRARIPCSLVETVLGLPLGVS